MEQLLLELSKINCDVEGALKRFTNSQAMYLKYLYRFPDENTLPNFMAAICCSDYEVAYDEIHTFKGITGSLGLTDLYQISQEIMVCLKNQEYEKANLCTKKLSTYHTKLVETILANPQKANLQK